MGNWHELSSAHFRVISDAPVRISTRVLKELELLRASLVTPLGLKEAQGGVDVILFADREGYARFAGKGSVAKTSWRTRRPLMLLAARGPDEAPHRSLLAHELTHAMSHAALGPQPRWVAEGLAEWLERLEVSRDASKATLPPAHTSSRWNREAAGALLPLSALWHWDVRLPPRAQLPRYYASAWGWTTFLEARYPEQLAAFHAGLKRGTRARRAFSDAFESKDPEVLWREARAWLGKGNGTARRWPIQALEAADAKQVTLSQADATVVLAWVRLLGFDGRALKERRQLAGQALTGVLKDLPEHSGASHLASLLDADWESEVAALAELR